MKYRITFNTVAAPVILTGKVEYRQARKTARNEFYSRAGRSATDKDYTICPA